MLEAKNNIDDKVRKSFDKAATTYQEYAVLQKQVAAGVEHLCMRYGAQNAAQLLDLGAGTGFVTLPLLHACPNSQVTALDFSQNMLNTMPDHKNLTKVCADFRSLPLENDTYNIVSSSLALQWGQDLNALFKGVQQVIAKDGYLIFATLLENSLHELRACWKQVDGEDHINQFVDKQTLTDSLQAAGLELVEDRRETITLHYASVVDILKSLKGIGANTRLNMQSKSASGGGLGGKEKIKKLAQNYESYRVADRDKAGLPLSYDVQWFVMKKK